MARQASDIVQRLTLNGQQFSSEIDRVFGGVQTSAAAANADMRREFATTFQQVEQLAKRAINAPRAASGSLSVDPAGARAAAQAAHAEAIALREVATAMERVIKQNGVLNAAESSRVMGARAAADAAEAHARSLAQEARFLDLVQVELNQTTTATDGVIEKNRQLNAATRGSGMATMQASQQFQDFFIQVQGGQNVLVAFSQQVGQLAFVLQGTEGIAGKFGKFLAGGWGTLVMGGLMVLSMFGDKIMDTGDEIAKETAELEKNAAKTRAMEAAKQAYLRTADGVIDKIREETAEWEKQNRTIFENLAQRLNVYRDRGRDAQVSAKQNVEDLSKAYRELSEAEAAASKARERAARASAGAGGEAARGQLAAAEAALARKQKEVKDLEQRGRDLDRTITDARRLERSVESEADEAKLAQKMDAERAAAEKLADALKLLDRQYADGEISRQKRASESRRLREEHESELKRIRARKEAEREAAKPAGRTNAAADRGAGILQKAQSYTGLSERTQSGRSQLMELFKEANQRVDPKITAWCAAFVNAVLATQGLPSSGSLAARDFLKYGTATNSPVQGDIVVLKRGNNEAQGHVGFYAGRTKDGGIRVTGGNQGDAVSTATYSAKDVLGYRRAPTAANDNKAAERLAEQYDRILATSMKQLDVEAETLRFMGLKSRGLDDQMQLEMEIAGIAREHAERMAEMTADQRREQSQVKAEFLDAAIVLRSQADAYASLREGAGDLSNLTDEQRAALEAANAAMLEQLELARSLATTAEERRILEVEIARAKSRVSVADRKGDESGRDAKQRAEEAKRDAERTADERAERERDRIMTLADFYRDAFRHGTGSIVENFKDEMLDVISELAARWTIALLTTGKTPKMGNILADMGAQSGVGGGGLLGGLLGSIGKKKQSEFASSFFPGAGDLPKDGAGSFGALGKAGNFISSALPYVAIAGALLPMITSIFTSPKWGSASINLNRGVVSGGEGVGKGASQIKAATGGAGSVAEGINRLAEQLGATIMSIPGVTIGTWDGKARVALTNTSGPLHAKSAAGKAGLIKDFGEGGEQEAIQYAIQYAFTNAALDGISQASKNIIKAGGDDVASAITKALLIEDVPKRLQAILDPVGYSIDTFNKSWEKTIAALKEGGASAEQMAEAQKLYKLELEQTKASAREASADLKSFLSGLNFGSGSPYSLRDQERQAYAALKPFEDAILRGERIDQGKFTDAAQTWLDLQRQLFGSTGSFFDAMGKVQDLTAKAIADIDNAKPIRVETDPWVKAGATASQASADLLDQLSRQTAESAAILARIAAAVEGSGGGFMNESRLYA